MTPLLTAFMEYCVCVRPWLKDSRERVCHRCGCHVPKGAAFLATRPDNEETGRKRMDVSVSGRFKGAAAIDIYKDKQAR